MSHINVEAIFQQSISGFYDNLFNLLQQLNINKDQLKGELKVVALLHDIGKMAEDKSIIISHPLTCKPAPMRYRLVSLLAAIEIVGPYLETLVTRRAPICRTIDQLHDLPYGLFRENQKTSIITPYAKRASINHKIHLLPPAGLMKLLVFKLAVIHGHDNIADVLWFYHIAKQNYFTQLHIALPVPEESEIH